MERHGESGTVCRLTEPARMNAGLERMERAPLDVAPETLLESDKSPRMKLRFGRCPLAVSLREIRLHALESEPEFAVLDKKPLKYSAESIAG